MQAQSRDFTVITLPHRQWMRFKQKADYASQGHGKGGWPDRLRTWHGQMNVATRSVWLSHQSDRPRRLDDMTFIVHAIEQRNIGGWQKEAFDIFAGVHPRFTGLTIKPRPGRR